MPATGTFGNHVRNGVKGPGRWGVDLALSRLIRLAGTHEVEARLEAFNLLNTFNWGNPNTNFGAGYIRSDYGRRERSAHLTIWGKVWLLAGLSPRGGLAAGNP